MRALKTLKGLVRIGVPTLTRLLYRQEPLRSCSDRIVLEFLRPEHIVMDAGCGKESQVSAKGRCRLVVGVDRNPSEAVGIDELVAADLSRLPFKGASFDVIVSWMVVEHLESPYLVFKEFYRVCKEGSLLVLATTNLLHYETLIASITPHRFHQWFVKSVLKDSREHFPTVYRANTPGRLAEVARRAGFDMMELSTFDLGPMYTEWLTPVYALGFMYHHLVNKLEFLSSLRPYILGVFGKAKVVKHSFSY